MNSTEIPEKKTCGKKGTHLQLYTALSEVTPVLLTGNIEGLACRGFGEQKGKIDFLVWNWQNILSVYTFTMPTM